MAQLSASITTNDPDFRASVIRLLRSSGLSISVADDKHVTTAPPDLAVVDIRCGTSTAAEAIERLRAAWPSASIFAVASTAEPDQILQAMRAGANEYLAWDQGGPGAQIDEAFHTALKRTVDRNRPAKDSARSGVTLSFFGAKGGVGTTTLAVNSAIEIARLSKRPTLIVDLHQFLGEVTLFLGVRPRFTVIDALDNLHRIDQEFLRELVVKHKSGLDILAGGDQIDRPGPQDAPAIEQLLQTLGRSYDFIVIDAGAITGPAADAAVFAADTVYLVANPDVASIRNAHRLVDRFEQLGAGKDRLRILLNRMSEQHQIAPKQIETTLGHSLHMMFPSDYSVVSAAMNSGVPLTLTNHSELAAQFASFTRDIVKPGSTAAPEEAGRPRAAFLGIF
ncbi:MAG TPA: AAA family ATPase [Vicinamibacterales bacterium]|nr:AAA family ATPase [Vicinamibacterales bacterium]